MAFLGYTDPAYFTWLFAQSFTAQVTTVAPNAPTNVVAISASGTSMNLSWTQPSVGTPPLTYSSQYRLKGTGSGASIIPQILPGGYISTAGNQFVDVNGNYVRIAATSFSGAEYGQFVPGQLWRNSYRAELDALKAAGINTIRWLYSDYMVLFNPKPTYQTSDGYGSGNLGINTVVNPSLNSTMTTLQCWDVIVAYCTSIGMKVIFAKAGNEVGAGAQIGDQVMTGLWYGDTGNSGRFYSSADCIAVQTTLAARYAGNSTVIGLELNNEVRWPTCTYNSGDATTDIAKFWKDCGNAIHAVNPNLLVICTAPLGPISTADYASSLARCNPLPSLNVQNKLVFSVHNFPAVVSGYSDLSTATLDYSFGFVFKQNIAPIFVSEMGFPNDFTQIGNGSSPDQTGCLSWKNAFTAYLQGISGIPAGGSGPSWAWFCAGPSGAEDALPDTGTDQGFALLSYAGLVALDPPLSYIKPIMFYGTGTGSVPFTAGSTGITGLSTAISGLVVNNTYDFQIAATNPSGTSAWSVTGNGTTTNAASQNARVSVAFKTSVTFTTPPIFATASVLFKTAAVVATNNLLAGNISTLFKTSASMSGSVTSNIHYNLVAWAASTSKTLNSRVSSGGNAYQCITAGTTSGTALSGTGSSITNGTSVWKWLSAIDYTNVQDWADALPATLTSPVVGQLWANGNITTTAGNEFFHLTDHTTSSTNTITLRSAVGESLRDLTGTLAYRTNACVTFQQPATAGGVNYITIYDSNVFIDGIQFVDPLATSNSTFIYLNNPSTSCTISNCIFDGYAQAGGACFINISDSGTFSMYNCLVIDRQGAAAAGTVIVGQQDVVPAFVNNTFISTASNTNGFVVGQAGGTGSLYNGYFRNCIMFGYAHPMECYVADHCCFTGSNIAGYDATDGGNNLFSKLLTNNVTSTVDFRLKPTADCINTGVADPTEITSADDIRHVSRPHSVANWSIGCVEY